MSRAKTFKSGRAKFDYSLDYKNLNLRTSPELYRIGLGEQGVLSVEPYKSEILPFWRFKTPDIARDSSQELKSKFEEYRRDKDFIGMDMTRKFIQMGVTRARRYANWSGGKKYTGEVDEKGKKITVDKGPEDTIKAESARIFGVVLKEVQADQEYIRLAQEHKYKHEGGPRPAIKKEGDVAHHSDSTKMTERTASSRIKEETEDAVVHSDSKRMSRRTAKSKIKSESPD